MPAHIRGRRRALNQKNKVEVCNHIAHGATVEEAADTIGVSLRTVQREAKLDEDFDHELKLAQGTAPDPLRMMQTAARTHWRAAAWLLERTDPDRYAKRPASSASPEQFEQALTFILEAALEATAPERRAAVYQHVQAACDEAFKCVFHNFGPWDRRRPTSLPATPLADGEHLKQVRDPSGPYQIPDYDDETGPRGPLAHWGASPTAIPQNHSTSCDQHAVNGDEAPSAIGGGNGGSSALLQKLHPLPRVERTSPPNYPVRSAATTTSDHTCKH